jgi:dimethylargininase
VNGTALVREPSSRLAEGIVTHIKRSPVDMARARAQHTAYAAAVAACGWVVAQAPAAEDCPDSVFIEDAVVVCEDLAVLTRPGAPARRAEVAGVAPAVQSLGLRTAQIQAPGGPGQAARRRTSQMVAAMSSADSASSQPASIHWTGQNRLAGW